MQVAENPVDGDVHLGITIHTSYTGPSRPMGLRPPPVLSTMGSSACEVDVSADL